MFAVFVVSDVYVAACNMAAWTYSLWLKYLIVYLIKYGHYHNTLAGIPKSEPS